MGSTIRRVGILILNNKKSKVEEDKIYDLFFTNPPYEILKHLRTGQKRNIRNIFAW